MRAGPSRLRSDGLIHASMVISSLSLAASMIFLAGKADERIVRSLTVNVPAPQVTRVASKT